MPRGYLLKIFAAALTGCIFLGSCKNELPKKPINGNATGKDEALNVTIRYSIAGIKKAILKGPVMYRVQDTTSYVEFPKTVHVDFYNPHDSIESKLDARYAKYNDGQSKVFLKDSVRVINVLGDTLYCNELYWDRNRTGTEFYTDKPVRIRTKTRIIDGIGMEARQDFKQWYIIKPVGIIKVPGTDLPN